MEPELVGGAAFRSITPPHCPECSRLSPREEKGYWYDLVDVLERAVSTARASTTWGGTGGRVLLRVPPPWVEVLQHLAPRMHRTVHVLTSGDVEPDEVVVVASAAPGRPVPVHSGRAHLPPPCLPHEKWRSYQTLRVNRLTPAEALEAIRDGIEAQSSTLKSGRARPASETGRLLRLLVEAAIEERLRPSGSEPAVHLTMPYGIRRRLDPGDVNRLGAHTVKVRNPEPGEPGDLVELEQGHPPSPSRRVSMVVPPAHLTASEADVYTRLRLDGTDPERAETLAVVLAAER